MKKLHVCAMAMCLAAVASGASGGDDDRGEGTVLEFKKMAAVTGPFVGAANPVRGINGGGLPWVISSARGELNSDGRLEVTVRGLVLADLPAVPAQLRLTNPVASFRAIVSCRTIDGMGQPAISNVMTDPFPASATGDARIEANVMLPDSCFSPLVFVTSPGGAWFAVTGFQK